MVLSIFFFYFNILGYVRLPIKTLFRYRESLRHSLKRKKKDDSLFKYLLNFISL